MSKNLKCWQKDGIMEFRTCWKQYTALKLRFVGGIMTSAINHDLIPQKIGLTLTLTKFVTSRLSLCKQASACLEDFYVKSIYKQHVNFMNWTWISLFEHRFQSIQQWLQTAIMYMLTGIYARMEYLTQVCGHFALLVSFIHFIWNDQSTDVKFCLRRTVLNDILSLKFFPQKITLSLMASWSYVPVTKHYAMFCHTSFMAWPNTTKGSSNVTCQSTAIPTSWHVHPLDSAATSMQSDQSLLGAKWAATWQNQQNECAPSEDSDQCVLSG